MTVPKPAPASLHGFRLVGICGKAGVGKDTVANILSRMKHSDRLWVHTEALADDVKAVASIVFSVDYDDFFNREVKENPIQAIGGYSPRRLSQLVGTDCFRQVFGVWVWVAALHRRLQHARLVADAVVVTDVRFASEVQWILEQDGVLVYLTRDAAAPVAAHASEQVPSLQLVQNMCEQYGGSVVVIENNGSMEELASAIDKQLVPLLVPTT